MDLKVKDIFDAQSNSVFSILGATGVAFQIPDYQRKYSWKTENIGRFIEDVVYGINSIENDRDTISFLGSIITVRLPQKGSMPSSPQSVVDGQQRLSTIVLTLLILHQEIGSLMRKLDQENDSEDLLIGEAKISLRNIKQCLFEDARMGAEEYDLYPIITRDIDTWGNSRRECKYISPVSKILHSYAKHIEARKENDFDVDEISNDDDFLVLASRIKYIKTKIEEVTTSEDEDVLLIRSAEDIINNISLRSELFHNPEKISDHIDRCSDEPTEIQWKEAITSSGKLIHLLCLSNYILQRVALTKVEANEKYAFDVFEALNTTGEPLTALETFKPKVISKINGFSKDSSAYSQSEAREYLSEVEDYLTSFGEDKKQKETQDITVSFALYLCGEKIQNHLSIQRKFLRDTFDRVKTESQAIDFVRGIKDISTYKSRFFRGAPLEDQLKGVKDRDEVLTCLEFLRSTNKTLTVPILARFFYSATETGDFTIFTNAVKALTAFTVIWRTSHPNTAGIDSVYRELMSFGYKTKKGFSNISPIEIPLCMGIDNKNKIMDLNRFRSILDNHLKAKGIYEFSDWFIKVKSMDVYNLAGPIAKMFILMAHHRTDYDKGTGTLKKDARPLHNECLGLSIWSSKRAASIEHIAPRKPEGHSTWDQAIYDTAYTVNTVGNLTLLPKLENSIVGNSNWELKKKFFNCFCQSTNTDLENAIKDAQNSGVKFSEKVLETLHQGEKLSLIEPLTSAPKWNKVAIDTRTKNISEVFWEQARSWL